MATKPINYKGVTGNNYSIYDRLTTEGSYLANQKRASNIKLLYWENFGRNNRFGYVLACICSFGILSIIRKSKIKRQKRIQSVYDRKIQMNNELKNVMKEYLERKAQGKTSVKEDKKIRKLLKKYGKTCLDMGAPYADLIAVKDGTNVSAVDLLNKKDNLQRFSTMNIIENDLQKSGFEDNGVQLFTDESTHESNQYLNAKDKKVQYEYDHVYIKDDGREYVDINMKNIIPVNVSVTDPATSIVSTTTRNAKSVRVRLDDTGRINFHMPENAGILKNDALVCEIIKKQPESILTLPKEYMEKHNVIKDLEFAKNLSGDCTGIKSSSLKTRGAQNLFTAYQEGVSDICDLGDNVLLPGTGKVVPAHDYSVNMHEKLLQHLENMKNRETSRTVSSSMSSESIFRA